MTCKIEQTKTADGLNRVYRFTAKSGKHRGNVFETTVYDCGHGAKIAWDRAKAFFGTDNLFHA